MLQTSTLPLSEEDILHHSKFISKEDKLALYQGFGENVCNLLICGDVLELDCALLNLVSDEVIPDLNMFRPVMEYWIL
jgi:hypothetical protein